MNSGTFRRSWESTLKLAAGADLFALGCFEGGTLSCLLEGSWYGIWPLFLALSVVVFAHGWCKVVNLTVHLML